MLRTMQSTLLVGALTSVVLALVTAGLADDAVTTGITYFQGHCARQQMLMHDLIAAVRVQDVSRATMAYVAVRRPYEHIETLSNAFPQLDADVDARPYALKFGEDNANFRGFLFFERALYRDARLDGSSVGIAHRLNRSMSELCKALTERRRFSPYGKFDGTVALAFEVSGKKAASEEEMWSDLSLMSF